MRTIFSAYDNFLFKFFDFGGRASRAEFWIVMPVLWLALFGLLLVDVHTFWGSLKMREVPPLNPIAYGSILLYVVTFVPRLSLTVRRMHDSGRRGKWAFAPLSALLLFGYLLLGVGTAMMSASPAAAGAGLSIFALFRLGSMEMFWEVMFAIAANADYVDWASVFTGLTSGFQTPDLGTVAGNVAQATQASPQMAVPMLIMTLIFVLGPFVTMGLYLLFLLMPSEMDENVYGFPPHLGEGPHRTAKGEHNAFASYAILTRTDRAPTASEVAARKAEVHSLYQQRVLRRDQG